MMKTSVLRVAVIGLAVSLTSFGSGCAKVRVVRVTETGQAERDLEGVRFYRPAPYLLVTPVDAKDANGGTSSTTKAELIYLPDVTQEYRAVVEPGWGTVDGNVALTNGWMLASLGAKLDSKGPETIKELGGLVTGIAGISLAPTTGGSKAVPKLYRIVLSGKTVTLHEVTIEPATRP